MYGRSRVLGQTRYEILYFGHGKKLHLLQTFLFLHDGDPQLRIPEFVNGSCADLGPSKTLRGVPAPAT